MAPSKGDSNELKRFLLASKESAVKEWLSRALSNAELRKKLAASYDPEQRLDILSGLYDAFVNPLSIPTSSGKTRKIRLKKAQKELFDLLSFHEIQRAQLTLLEALSSALRKKYRQKPRKLEKLTGQLTLRMHDMLLQVGKDAASHRKSEIVRAESKYARLLKLANDAVFLLNYETGLFVEANEAACSLTGYSESELKQMGINSLASVFDLNLALERAESVIEEGAIRFDDLSLITKRNASVPVDISCSAVTIDGARHILVIVRDIKERKALQKKVEQKAERLQLLNEIAQAITSADLDIEDVLTKILEGVARVMKVEAGSVLKVEEGELAFLVALGEKAEYVKPFRIKIGQGIAGWVAETGEGLIVRDVHKDPRYFPGVEQATGFISKSIMAVPLKSSDRIVGVIELINKIGGRFTKQDLELMGVIANYAAVALEHAGLYTECELARVRLAQTHSPISSSRLAAAVAQEMKDPLGIAKNYVQILADKLSAMGTKAEELAVVSDEVNRIANITDQLVRFAEAYSGEPKETPLNLLIENSIQSKRDILDATGIETKLKLAESLPQISVIPNQMKMIFSNLIKLSVAEMPDGGILTVVTRKRNSSICVEFSNTGAKHTKEEAGELFLPSGVAKGLVPKGLGLYMANNIIQGYGGEIEVKSRRGQGNTFRITIPGNSGGK